MAISTFAELKTAISNWSHRADLTSSLLEEFISLAEADLQIRANLTQWDTEATVTVTSGAGSLPADFQSLRSVRFGANDRQLTAISPAKGDYLVGATDPAEPINYFIVGSELRLVPIGTGDASILYVARFTPLSASATTNSLLTLFPDAYLLGSMVQYCIWANDDSNLQKYGSLFAGPDFMQPQSHAGAVGRVRKYTSMRRYGDAPLVMRRG
jgi:hypothetical protein